MNARILVALGVWLTAATAYADVQQVVYSCERGIEIPVVYINGEDAGARLALAVLVVEGRLVSLEATETGSGARYGTGDDQPGYVWWTKGDSASLSWLESESGAETMLFTDCAQR
ncbi:MliC family protein [Sulfitobacter sp. D35]|uniref:MliC family protein n=1 Tax=Sulfitobacter sp. D35 TaxID=3083252 RepID=UPI00296E527E|nr:MliC family protein [Sulfitobacter sp. D35]MDW4496768.1 MliC family protein [Sulfitobacter sp. D35]